MTFQQRYCSTNDFIWSLPPYSSGPGVLGSPPMCTTSAPLLVRALGFFLGDYDPTELGARAHSRFCFSPCRYGSMYLSQDSAVVIFGPSSNFRGEGQCKFPSIVSRRVALLLCLGGLFLMSEAAPSAPPTPAGPKVTYGVTSSSPSDCCRHPAWPSSHPRLHPWKLTATGPVLG